MGFENFDSTEDFEVKTPDSPIISEKGISSMQGEIVEGGNIEKDIEDTQDGSEETDKTVQPQNKPEDKATPPISSTGIRSMQGM